MTNASSWAGFYQTHPEGRCGITSPALKTFGIEHPDRILDTELWGRPARVLLLDKPLKLGEKLRNSDTDEFRLRRIRLHELPGWPPKMASSAKARSLPALMDCRLADATFSKSAGPGQEAVELLLEHIGRNYRAWHVGCPVPLLKCVEATLIQEEVVGRKMVDIQDVTLIGAEF